MDARLVGYALAVAGGQPVEHWERKVVKAIEQIAQASPQARDAARMHLIDLLRAVERVEAA